MSRPFALSDFFDDLSRAHSRVEAFAALVRRAGESMVADRVLIAIFDEGNGVWLGYDGDGQREWVALEIGWFASLTVLDKVRSSQSGVREPFRYRELRSGSWKQHAIRHALGVPLFHLGSHGERKVFAGCLYLDRREGREEFSDTEMLAAQDIACAAEVGLLALCHAAATRFNEPEDAGTRLADIELLRAMIATYHGNVAAISEDERIVAKYGCNSPRSRLRLELARLGLEAEARAARHGVNPQALLDSLRLTSDLFATARAFSLSFRGMNYRIMTAGAAANLRAFVQAHGLDWAKLRGPEFSRSTINKRGR
jgi:hypothetical protein